MNGMHIWKTWIWGSGTHTREFNFPPQYIVAYSTITGVGWTDGGNGNCCIQQYRQRQPDGSDTPINFSGEWWNSPTVIGVDNCSSVTFETDVNEGGYILANQIVTFW